MGRGCWGWIDSAASDQTASAGIHHGLPGEVDCRHEAWAVDLTPLEQGAHRDDRSLAECDDGAFTDDERWDDAW